jgi:hypothetical protein
MYKHTQIGWAMLTILGAAFLLVAALAITASVTTEAGLPAGFSVVVATVLGPLALLMVLFGSLTVRVADGWVKVRFGPGLVHKGLRLSDVAACEPVRNRWYYGLGARLMPGGGWLFNVSGLGAVELRMKDGARYRIGTDEPQKLAEHIQALLRPAGVLRPRPVS